MRLPFRRIASEFERAGGQGFRDLGSQVERNFSEIEKDLSRLAFVTGTTVGVNFPITTTPTAHVSVDIPVPSWASTALVTGWLVFDMHNPAAGVIGQQVRVTIEGEPTVGLAQNDVQPGGRQVLTYMNMRTLTKGVDLDDTITVAGVVAVHSGTNNTNGLRIRAAVTFGRIPEG